MRYKVFVLADSEGMTYDFLSYMGSIEPAKDENVPDLKACANFVPYYDITLVRGSHPYRR